MKERNGQSDLFLNLWRRETFLLYMQIENEYSKYLGLVRSVASRGLSYESWISIDMYVKVAQPHTFTPRYFSVCVCVSVSVCVCVCVCV